MTLVMIPEERYPTEMDVLEFLGLLLLLPYSAISGYPVVALVVVALTGFAVYGLGWPTLLVAPFLTAIGSGFLPPLAAPGTGGMFAGVGEALARGGLLELSIIAALLGLLPRYFTKEQGGK